MLVDLGNLLEKGQLIMKCIGLFRETSGPRSPKEAASNVTGEEASNAVGNGVEGTGEGYSKWMR